VDRVFGASLLSNSGEEVPLCPICGKQDKQSLWRHYFYSHGDAIEVIDFPPFKNGEQIKLWIDYYREQDGVYYCPFFEQKGSKHKCDYYNERIQQGYETIWNHIGSNHSNQITPPRISPIVPNTNMRDIYRQHVPSRPPLGNIFILSRGKATEVLMSYSRLDPQFDTLIGDKDIHKELENSPDHGELADGFIHYKSCTAALIEDKSPTDILKALRQLQRTVELLEMKHPEWQVRYAIYLCRALSRKIPFSRNKNGFLMKNKNHPYRLDGKHKPYVIVGHYNKHQTKDLWTAIEKVINNGNIP